MRRVTIILDFLPAQVVARAAEGAAAPNVHHLSTTHQWTSSPSSQRCSRHRDSVSCAFPLNKCSSWWVYLIAHHLGRLRLICFLIVDVHTIWPNILLFSSMLKVLSPHLLVFLMVFRHTRCRVQLSSGLQLHHALYVLNLFVSLVFILQLILNAKCDFYSEGRVNEGMYVYKPMIKVAISLAANLYSSSL